jgi:large subunit ribosomal protein L21
MYAVIRTGGKQYKVSEGDTLEVEHLSIKGNRVTFTPILVVTDDGKSIYGRKELRPFSVVAKVVGDTKGDKVDVFKYRSKTGHAVKRGHRQLYSMIEVTSIGERGAKEKDTAASELAEAPPETTESEASAAAKGAGESEA